MHHVLIVEDHEDNRNLLKMLLEANAYRVTAAGNGLEALAAARRDPPDIIVSDVLMPNTDGFALCRAWMQDTALKAIPFIFYSATYVRTEDEQFAMALGAVRYLIKPLGVEVFLQELRAVLQQWAGRTAPSPASPPDDASTHLLHESALARKLEDKIAQLEAAKRRLEQSEARFRSLTEMSSDFYWESDAEHRLTQRASADKKSRSVSIFERGMQIGERRWDIPYLSPDAAGWAAHRAVLDARQPFREFVLSRLGIDGSERFVSLSGDPAFDASGAFTGYRGIGTDITERKRVQNALQESEDRYRDLVENSQDLICTHNLEGRLLSVNAAAVRLTGYSREALLGMNMADLLASGAREGFAAYLAEIRAKGAARGLLRIRTADGQMRWWEYNNTLRVEGVEAPVVRGMAQDITERKNAEDELRASDARFRVTFEQAAVGIAHVAPNGRWLRVNQKLCDIVGYTREELLARKFRDITHPDDLDRDLEHLRRLVAKEISSYTVEKRYLHKDGRSVWIIITVALVRKDSGKPDYYISVIEDISARKRAEGELLESEERFRGLVEQTVAGIFMIQDGKYVYVNPRMVEIAGYASAEALIGRDSLSLVAEQDRSLVAQNMHERIEGTVPRKSYEFSMQRKDGSLIEIGVHSTRATYRGRPAILGLIQDISEKKRAEAKIERYVAQLQTAFMSTVKVATTLGEMRDPYTAGHQRRVAEIAVAIGAELGFDERRQEGLRVAGYLHDIGKIIIPSEILSKPGKLNAIEYQLIQGHAQSSYDVLKDLAFPWPVAEVALQHHERIDGSGYPQGLKGAAILIESRIMAVADVVEAMSSHRPYRAALGIEAALAEIGRNRGSAYDAEVADACLRLFREHGYQVPA